MKTIQLETDKVYLFFGKTCSCEDSADDMDYALSDVISGNAYFPFCQRCGTEYFLVSCVAEIGDEKSTTEVK